MATYRETVPNDVTRLHRQAMEASVQEVVGLLQDVLTRRLTAFVANVQSGRTIARWANGEVTEIRDHMVEQRLRTAYEIVVMLLEHDSPQVVRAWFIGLNPELGDVTPLEVIRDGQGAEAIAAAWTFYFEG